ncbi:phosphocholine-specific phospholipase C [Zavarzinella formosa]|uniref:phosphocholine-specific phospholipase C n=1 Tax=Zavarzinella formosa TaxID=360055 RepID=UPI0003752BBB|nr:phospholipase C, phosphocholine-specific [Zavarzinella formosa]
MQTRREFVNLAARIAAGTGVAGFLESIQRAAAIEPEKASTFLNAEHVVILMQENRSFDHAYGTLRGVRGFNDPRAITLPDGNPVWLQANAAGERYAPFRFDIHSSKVTWMGSLPHGWNDQVDARNHGLYDRWLTAKRPGSRAYSGMPLTLGHYSREDIPFYYAMADAFTICDQYFCSTLTGTTPNRNHLWSASIRQPNSPKAFANVRNGESDHDHLVDWPTFPERLENLGVSWKVYQNELTVETGLSGIEDDWLANYGDNPLEYFRQYHVHLMPAHRQYIDARAKAIPGEIASIKEKLAAHKGTAAEKAAIEKQILNLGAKLKALEAEIKEMAGMSLEKLPERERKLHEKAFCTNTGDPAYRQLTEITYRDGDQQRKMLVPKGDLFHQFRADVNSGKLPTVSWLVAPEKLSDHPSSAWYGAWYIAEALDILTKNPEVWKKTVFILTYDENDGYYDHVPPFVPPHPKRPETGLVTKGIDASLDYVELAQDRGRARESPVGLGYRVPMVIASPWSRGGCVYSQVADHTSVLRFLEKLLSHKLGKKVEETNITSWRRAVCGDLTASFQTTADQKSGLPDFGPRNAFLESIHRAQFKKAPGGFKPLTAEELELIRKDPRKSPLLPYQEEGVRRSCALPYQLVVDGKLNEKRTHFTIKFASLNEAFGDRSAGSPFTVYAMHAAGNMKVRNYAVEAGEHLEDSWALADFEGGRYHLRVAGPNGFFREFIGGADEPQTSIEINYTRAKKDGPELTGGIEIVATNRDGRLGHKLRVRDNSYHNENVERELASGGNLTLAIDTKKSHGWYDFSVRVVGDDRFEKRYAGRVETGVWGFSDPAMGKNPG